MFKPDPYFFPELPANLLETISCQEVNIGDQTIKIVSPSTPDALLDHSSVHIAYEQDEYMPYWASLWPVAVFLAEEIEQRSWPANISAVEVGCGLGLAGLVAAKKNIKVLFTDYDSNALTFAKKNCELNGVHQVDFELLDIRHPMDRKFNLIIVSDLIYERRNVEPLVQLIGQMLEENGSALVSDQGRPYQENFLTCLSENGFEWTEIKKKLFNSEKKEVTGYVFTIKRRN
jgi:predicted nicotinamide N-methyase